VLVVLNHGHLNPSYFTYFIYMQNMHHDWIGNFQPFFNLNHLWSLAVEEQYYLLWPVVVWLVWRREWLLGVCYTVIFLGLIAGILWPYTGLSYDVGYYSTLTRCGALMMGAALALHHRSPAMKLETLELPAKLVLAAGFACILIKFFCRGSAAPCTYSGVAFLIPLTNLMSAAVVVLAILPGNGLYRCCIQPWAISLGNLSYGLYVLHYVAYDFFFTCLPGLLHPILGSIGARAVSGCFAFSITYVGAKLSYHLLELPAMRMKDRLRYGEREETATEPLLRLADATRTALHGLEHLPQRLISRPAAISRSF
jgi:peptidoglycan/LPS O-acetylase OafA/YrhL